VAVRQQTGGEVTPDVAGDARDENVHVVELIARFEEEARARLPEAVHDYYAGGAGDEQTLAENVDAWRRVWLRPRGLVDVSDVDTSVELLGHRLALPVLLAPVAAQRFLHPDGEVASARAAVEEGTVYVLSTRATVDLGEVGAAVTTTPPSPLWFQLYIQPDRSVTETILRRLRPAGYSRVVVTIDLPVLGRRERELRHGGVPLPEGVQMATHLGDGTAPAALVGGGWDATLRWDDLDWVREASGLPVVVKGVVTAEDARLAVEHGAEAVIVSNHGGRQLDGCVPTAVALREVAAELVDEVPVLVDGGIRSGTDVVRALALGADAVLIGRPYAWALAAGGEDGVRRLLSGLADDIRRTLALVGVTRPAEVGSAHARLAGW
jgi:4-hydroxymandelate oxidase